MPNDPSAKNQPQKPAAPQIKLQRPKPDPNQLWKPLTEDHAPKPTAKED